MPTYAFSDVGQLVLWDYYKREAIAYVGVNDGYGNWIRIEFGRGLSTH